MTTFRSNGWDGTDKQTLDVDLHAMVLRKTRDLDLQSIDGIWKRNEKETRDIYFPAMGES